MSLSESDGTASEYSEIETLPNMTSPKKGKERCALVEGKSARAQMLPNDVTQQLQADMVLYSAPANSKTLSKQNLRRQSQLILY